MALALLCQRAKQFYDLGGMLKAKFTNNKDLPFQRTKASLHKKFSASLSLVNGLMLASKVLHPTQ